MQLVRSRATDDVDLCARRASELGLVVGRVQPELAHRIKRRADDETVDVEVVVVDAVEQEAVGCLARPAHVDPRAVLARQLRAGCGVVNARGEQGQVQELALVERQLSQRSPGNERADLGAVGLERSGRLADVDRGALDWQQQLQVGFVGRPDFDARTPRPSNEILSVCDELVLADQQPRVTVTPFGVSHGARLAPRLKLQSHDEGISDRGARGVEHRSTKSASAGLTCERRRAANSETKCDQAPQHLFSIVSRLREPRCELVFVARGYVATTGRRRCALQLSLGADLNQP